MEYVKLPNGCTRAELTEAEIKQAIAHFLSRQGTAQFLPDGIEMTETAHTEEIIASALSIPADGRAIHRVMGQPFQDFKEAWSDE